METMQLQAPQAQPEMKERKKKARIVIAIGKRKKAVARAIAREGKGRIRINGMPLRLVEPRYRHMRINEAVVIAGELASGVDIDVTVNGGGTWGQADAVRTAIANAIVKWTKNEKLRNMYVDYDRTLLIPDARRTEPHKPSRSTAGPRRTKQQSKR
jgi:small subunit ribosomal protein S9